MALAISAWANDDKLQGDPGEAKSTGGAQQPPTAVSEGQTPPKSDHTGLVSPSSTGAMDQALTNKIHQALVGMTELQGSAISSGSLANIKVSAHRGIVTLRGLVNSLAEKTLIADRVQRMDSVLVVKNELQVAGQVPTDIGRPSGGEAGADSGKQTPDTKTSESKTSGSPEQKSRAEEASAVGGVKSETARPADQ